MIFDERVSVPSHVLAREVQGEMVLLNLESESYFGLDSVGTRIWKRVLESTTVEEAYKDLLEEFEVEPDRLREDMEVLLHELMNKGLLVLQQL